MVVHDRELRDLMAEGIPGWPPSPKHEDLPEQAGGADGAGPSDAGSGWALPLSKNLGP